MTNAENKKLVSIITPCFNGEEYLPDFLKSILGQTYRPIELTFVDDGSFDKTKEIFESYREKFEHSGITARYIYQRNAGQASAVNKALPLFAGDYLMWVDSDDILLPQNIQKKVDYLESHPEKGFVLCEGMKVYANDLNASVGTLARKAKEPLDRIQFFNDLIMEHNVVYGPGTILARRQAVLTAIPSLHIFEGHQGQNWQLMLPLAYCFDYGLIPEQLFKYVIHSDSHSHSQRLYDELIERNDTFCELIIYTIKNIPNISLDELVAYEKKVKIKYTRRKLEAAYSFRKMNDAKHFLTLLKKEHANKFIDCISNKFIRKVYHFILYNIEKIRIYR